MIEMRPSLQNLLTASAAVAFAAHQVHAIHWR
jgi:hypothetical protein